MPSFLLTDDVKEVILMNEMQKTQITSLRHKGYGYDRIAQALGLSKNTVKSWCRRNHLTGAEIENTAEVADQAPTFCLTCGKPIMKTPGKREKKFCSDACRMKWWNSHQDQVKRKAIYSFICPCCHKPFTAYGNSKRKYCSHACYIEDRFGGEHCES